VVPVSQVLEDAAGHNCRGSREKGKDPDNPDPGSPSLSWTLWGES
jgi:hypothetical protein